MTCCVHGETCWLTLGDTAHQITPPRPGGDVSLTLASHKLLGTLGWIPSYEGACPRQLRVMFLCRDLGHSAAFPTFSRVNAFFVPFLVHTNSASPHGASELSLGVVSFLVLPNCQTRLSRKLCLFASVPACFARSGPVRYVHRTWTRTVHVEHDLQMRDPLHRPVPRSHLRAPAIVLIALRAGRYMARLGLFWTHVSVTETCSLSATSNSHHESYTWFWAIVHTSSGCPIEMDPD